MTEKRGARRKGKVKKQKARLARRDADSRIVPEEKPALGTFCCKAWKVYIEGDL